MATMLLACLPVAMAYADSGSRVVLDGSFVNKDSGYKAAYAEFFSTRHDMFESVSRYGDYYNEGTDLHLYENATSNIMMLEYVESVGAFRIYAAQCDGRNDPLEDCKVWENTEDRVEIHSIRKSTDSSYLKQFYAIEKDAAKDEYFLKNVGTGQYLFIEDDDSKEHLRQYPDDGSRGRGEPFVIDLLSYHTTNYGKVGSDPGWMSPHQFDCANAWMKDVPDDAVVSTINMPATHDTACTMSNLSAETKTQKYTYEQQLNIGTRMFDVRIDGRTDGIWLNHNGYNCYNPLNQEYDFYDFARQTVQFLDANPSETVFWVLKHEKGTEELNSLGVLKLLETTSFYDHLFKPEKSYVDGAPLMGDVRGKVVLLVRRYDLSFPSVEAEMETWNRNNPDRPITKEMFGYPVLGWDDLPYSSNYQAIKAYDHDGAKVYVQDYYSTLAETKWEYVENTLAQTAFGETKKPDGQPIVHIEGNGWVLNYTSCTWPLVAEPHYTSQLINKNLFTDTTYINNRFLGTLFYNYIDGMLARQVIATNFAEGADFIKIHQHDLRWVLDQPATLNRDGSKHQECATCGRVFQTASVSKIAGVQLSRTAYTYTGAAKNPTLTVKDVDGKVLAKGDDYTVTVPSGRKAVGKHTYKVSFRGDYAGTKSVWFTIKPATAAVKSLTPGTRKLTVKMTTKPTTKGGSAFQIGYLQKGASKWKYVATTSQSKAIKSLKKGKQYYVKVRAYKKSGGTTYYGPWSKTKLSKKIK
ncbi:MAG: hypothetical protein Q4D06_02340 [Coriobacteriia bacterium]|nr:hypothetical protein [Coriobacteriia bacterium]